VTRENLRQDAGKPTQSLVTPIIAKPIKNSKSSQEETQDAMLHDAGKSKPNVATPNKNSKQQIKPRENSG
jgi:hypothetical protein